MRDEDPNQTSGVPPAGSAQDRRVVTDPSSGAASPTQATPALFGRGMIYVLVWSMQLLVATFVSPVLAHTLNQEQFGRVAAILALYQLIITINVLGTDQALEVRRVEDGDNDRPARGLLATGIIYAFTISALLIVSAEWWAPLIGFSGHVDLVLVMLIWTAPGAAVLMCLSMLQAEDRLRRFATVSLVSSVGSQLVGITLLFTVHRDPVTYATGAAVAQTLAFLVGMYWTRPIVGRAFNRDVTRQALLLGLPLALSGVSEFILSTADRLVIQVWLGPAEVATYQVAFVIGNATTLVLIFTNRAWLPRLAGIRDDVARWRMICSARDGVYQLVGWSLLGITIATPALLRVFVPATYDRQLMTMIVWIVGLCALPVAAMGASTRMFITMRWSRPLMWSSISAIATKIVLTPIVLPLFGVTGAAVSTLGALTAQAVYLRLRLSRVHESIPSARLVLAHLAGCAVLAGISTQLPMTPVWDICRLAVAVALIAPFALSLRRLQQQEESGVTASV